MKSWLRTRRGRWLAAALLVIFGAHLWLYATNPFAAFTIVQQPYTTSMRRGQITVQRHFTLRVYAGMPGQVFGTYKSGLLLAQHGLFGGPAAPADSAEEIIAAIHALRFDPARPYLISGDQFSVLYPRNLGVFYNALLDPYTALNKQDWQNRQRIYLQSALYALDAFSAHDTLATTVVPSGPHSAALYEFAPGTAPSDALYGVLYALYALQDETAYTGAPYQLQTVQAARQIIAARRSDLQKLLAVYLRQVRDPRTGLVKRGLKLSGARDAVTRDSSFYDNVIMWSTLRLVSQLGVQPLSAGQLDDLRQRIIATFWNNQQGHFRDDMSNRAGAQNYSSDWLIALPAGFLSPQNPADLPYLQRSVAFIRAQGIAQPFPIKYTAAAVPASSWAVRTFAPSYGSNDIWSYWGAQYLTLLAQLYRQTGRTDYQQEAQQGIAQYNQKIVQYRGFPETFTPQGNLLQTLLYKSIRQTGWVVQFEQAEQQLDPAGYQLPRLPAAAAPQTPAPGSFWLCHIKP